MWLDGVGNRNCSNENGILRWGGQRQSQENISFDIFCLESWIIGKIPRPIFHGTFDIAVIPSSCRKYCRAQAFILRLTPFSHLGVTIADILYFVETHGYLYTALLFEVVGLIPCKLISTVLMRKRFKPATLIIDNHLRYRRFCVA